MRVAHIAPALDNSLNAHKESTQFPEDRDCTMKKSRRIGFAVLLVAILGAVVWSVLPRRDPVFHGKSENSWIKEIEYNGPDEQTRIWREFGPEGIRVLVRGLEAANHPVERTYRKVYRQMWRVLPGRLMGLLPAPRMDSGRSTRMRVVALLSRLAKGPCINNFRG